MPFKSEAQRRKFAQMVQDGKMSQKTFDEWNKETGNAKLPERTKDKTNKVRSIDEIRSEYKRRFSK